MFKALDEFSWAERRKHSRKASWRRSFCGEPVSESPPWGPGKVSTDGKQGGNKGKWEAGKVLELALGRAKALRWRR